MTISKKTRFEVFKRDRFTCQYCGKKPPEVMLEADHVVPKCEGGRDDVENLTTACFACNRGKAGNSLGAVAPALDEEQVLAGIQEMMERAALLKQSAKVAQAQADAEAEVIWQVREWWIELVGNDYCVEDASIRRFLKLLDVDALREAVERSSGRPGGAKAAWKYFCGTCWGMIRARESEAESNG